MIVDDTWKVGLAIMSVATLLVAGAGTALGFGVKRLFRRA